MTEIDYSKLRSLTARRLISALIKDGFHLDRESGSHQQYLHPNKGRVTVSFHHPSDTFPFDDSLEGSHILLNTILISKQCPGNILGSIIYSSDEFDLRASCLLANHGQKYRIAASYLP